MEEGERGVEESQSLASNSAVYSFEYCVQIGWEVGGEKRGNPMMTITPSERAEEMTVINMKVFLICYVDFKKTLAVLIDNLLTRVDYLENKVNSLSVVRPSLPAPGRWLGNESHVELLSSQRMMRESDSSSRGDAGREKVDDPPVGTDAEDERRIKHGAFGDALKNISDGRWDS